MSNDSAQAGDSTSAAEKMTPGETAEARRYGQQSLVLELADLLLDVSYLAVMAFVLAVPLDAWLTTRIPADGVRLAAMFAVVFLLHECFSFPLAFYSGYVFEHRYGLSTQTVGRWLRQHFKHYLIAAVFNLLMFAGLFWIIWMVGRWWWLAAAAVSVPLTVLIGQLAPVLIMPLFYKTERIAEGELRERLERLAAAAGLSLEGVYRIEFSQDTVKANAMLAGLGRTRRVLLGDTLLEKFTPDEIEVVFAHEMGHHVFGHIPKLIGWAVVSITASFWLCDRGLALWLGSVTYDPALLPVAALPMVMLLLRAFGTLSGPLLNIVSRRFERQCDRYALETTGLRSAYRSAFGKLARLNKDDPRPNPVAVFLFHNHPPIAERLAMADH